VALLYHNDTEKADIFFCYTCCQERRWWGEERPEQIEIRRLLHDKSPPSGKQSPLEADAPKR
jgi:hypothetical protein